MKKFLCMFMAVGMLLAGVSTVYGAQEVSVEIDGDTVVFGAQKPVIVNGRTLIPLRGVFEKMGYTVTWVGETKTAVLRTVDTTVEVSAGSSSFKVNNESKSLDVPAQIMNGSMMLPLRAIGESAGANVTWNGAKKLVEIDTKAANMTDIIKGSDYLVNYSRAVENLKDAKALCTEMQNLEGELNADELQSYLERLHSAKKNVESVREAVENLEVPDDMEELQAVRLEAIDKFGELIDVLIDFCDGEIDIDTASDRVAEIAAAESEISKKNNRILDSVIK